MKALVYTDVETLEYRDVPAPKIDDDQVLVRVVAAGVCGSDMHAYLGHDARRPAPLILGHEAAGVVASGPDEGRRVTFNPLVTCGTCQSCRAGRTNLCASRQIVSIAPRQGVFADYVAIPGKNLVDVPGDVGLEHAALAEPLACGWHGVRVGLSGIDVPAADATCLVLGGGAIGLGAALCLKAQGVQDITVIEANPGRLAVLRDRCGLNAVQPKDFDPGSSFDLAIDGVGIAGTRATASATVRPGGMIVHIGLGESEGGLDIRRMTLQEITFVGTYTYTAADFEATAEAIFDGRLGSLDWIDIQPLSDGANTFKKIKSGNATAPKTILIPEQSAADLGPAGSNR